MAKAPAKNETIRVPSNKKLTDLARRFETMKEKTSALSGEIGQEIHTMSEKDNLHPQAFKAAMALKKKDAAILRNYLDHFEHYCEVLGVYKKAEDAPPLPIDEEEGEEAEGNVTPLRAAE